MSFKERTDRHKVAARISVANFERLKELAVKYGFRTANDIVTYIVFCFLRATDDGNDECMYAMPEDILSLFPITADIHDVQLAVAKVRRARLKRKKVDEDDDIREMFSECEAEGARLEFGPNIRGRSER